MKDNVMKGQWANPDTIICKDCVYRDKCEIELNGKIIRAGVTKSYCEMYPKESTNGKPNGILFQNEDCDYYEKE